MLQQPGSLPIPAGWPGLTGAVYPDSFGQQPTQGLPAQQVQLPPPQFMPPFPAPFPSQPQGQASVQPQAAPVAPVAFPQGQGQQQPNPAQVMTQQLIQMAKSLEQLIPGYQALLSLLMEASGPSPSPSLNEAVRSVERCLFYHGATLGSIRRLLCGETSPSVLTNLAAGYHALSQAQPRVRAAAEQVLGLVPSAQRSLTANLLHSLSTADNTLAGVGTAIQNFVGPQAWESALARA